MPLEPRTEQVMIRLTPQEARSVKDAARLKGERLGTMLRDVVVRWAKRVQA